MLRRLVLACLLIPALAFAGLVAQSSGPGMFVPEQQGLTDGATVTINGSGFGSNSGAVQLFTGGLTSAQETTADDTIYSSVSPASFKTGSTSVCGGSPGNQWRIDTGRSYGVRTRSLYWDSTDARNNCVSNVGQSVMAWKPGLSALGSAYIAWKQYMVFPSGLTEVQFKTLRFVSQIDENGFDGVEDSADSNMLLSNWHDGGSGGNYDWIGYFALQPSGDSNFWPPSSLFVTYFNDSGWGEATSGYPAISAADDNGWFEVEVEFIDSSTLSSSDGLISLRLRNLSTGAVVSTHVRPNARFYRGSGALRYKALLLQTGLFNGAGGGVNEGGNGKVWYQDIYFEAASMARVRLTTVQACSKTTTQTTEIQEIVSWSDTAIEVKVNQGGHSTLAHSNPLYWCVWKSDGALATASGILAN